MFGNWCIFQISAGSSDGEQLLYSDLTFSIFLFLDQIELTLISIKMMRYNFRPNLTDHAQVQILVRPFFNSSEQDFTFVLNKLQTFTHANIEDDERKILLKFTKGHSRESFEWGRLQLHRRPLGFVGVARISSDPGMQAKDYAKIETRFGNLISQYDSYLFDSRCIIIGPENHQIPVLRKDMIYLAETDDGISSNLIDSISDFVTSIYVILESKRVEKISENFERMVLPTAPNESDSVSGDMDSRYIPFFNICFLSQGIRGCDVEFSIFLKSVQNYVGFHVVMMKTFDLESFSYK